MHKFEKIGSYVLLLLLSILLLAKGVQPAWTSVHSDFANYYVSAKLVSDGVSVENIYNNEWFQHETKEYRIDTHGKFAPFPPITAFLLLPLVPFDPLTAQRIFTLVNIAFIGLGIFVVKKITTWAWPRCALVILISGQGIVNSIAFGQIYWIMTVFILYSFWWKDNNHLLPAAIVLSFFSCLKYFPAAFIGGYFLLGLLRWKEGIPFKKNTDLLLSLYSILFVSGLFLFQYFFFGEKLIQEFIQSAFLPHLEGELKGQGLYSFQFQSWDVFFRNLFVPDPQFNGNAWMNWPLGKPIFKMFITGLVAVLTVLILIKFRSEPMPKKRIIYLSLPAIAALVVLPVSATYHFILLLPPLVLLLCDKQMNPKRKMTSVILYAMIGFIPYGLAFKLGGSWGLIFAFPRLILMTFLFCIIIFDLVVRKKTMNESFSD